MNPQLIDNRRFWLMRQCPSSVQIQPLTNLLASPKMSWTRPKSIPFPSVWHRFQAKAPDSDAEVSYLIQDLPEDRFEDGVAFMSRFFPHDEQMNQVLGLASDSVAMKGVVQLWREMLKLKLSVVCFREGSPEIVGLNVLGVASKEDRDDEKFASAIFQTIFDTIGYVSQQANVFQRYGVDRYLNAMGLSVDPTFRGRGIATEILKARVPLCRAVGLRLTSTCFTGAGSQKAAARAGFQEDFSITYGELRAVNERFVFPGIEQKPCKYMSLKVD